jgi:hypothetical protein
VRRKSAENEKVHIITSYIINQSTMRIPFTIIVLGLATTVANAQNDEQIIELLVMDQEAKKKVKTRKQNVRLCVRS